MVSPESAVFRRQLCGPLASEHNDHRGRKVIYFGGAECNKSVTTLARKACHLGGSEGMLPQENIWILSLIGLDLVCSLRF